MFHPELFQESNIMPRRDSQQYLEKYAKEIKWKNDGVSVIDIGCGDGGITTNILKSFIPTNFKELVGCDISEQMIKYANANRATDRIYFKVLDIEGDLPEEFHEKFDLAFSNYALQWIRNQEFAFSNIYDLLAKGGDCFLTALGNLAVYDVYRELVRNPRWKPFLGDVERFVSPYHDSQKPDKDMNRIMTKIGFTNVKVKCEEKEFIYYGEEIFKKAMLSVSPYKIPLELQEDYWKDYVKAANDLKIIDYGTNGDQFNVKFIYKLIIAFGQK